MSSTLPISTGPQGGEEDFRSTRVPLIAYVADRETLSVLRDAMSPTLGPTAIFRQGGMVEARTGLKKLQTPLAALIVDVSGEADPLAALETLALHVEPGVRVFVIGEVEDMEFYRHVTRGLGVLEYLCKPLNRDIVARNFLPAITGNVGSVARTGRVVTVTGVRGGVGATTVAVNLAMQLAERSRHHTLLFDADLHSGTAALMLSTTVGGGLRAALENPGRVDVLFAERSSPAINDRLSLLAAEEALDQSVHAPEGAARHLTQLLCSRYNFIVIDLPRFSTPLNHELRDLTHVRVLVMDATLPSLRDALRHMAVPPGPEQPSRPIVVLNRADARGTLSRKQIVSGMGGNVDIVVPWLPKRIQTAATLGKPAVGKSGPFQTAITQLADEILPKREQRNGQRFGLLKMFRS